MDRHKFEQRCAIKFCVKLSESATVTYGKYKGLMENIPYPGHKCSYGISPLQKVENKWKTNLVREDLQPQKRTTCGNTEVSCEVRLSIEVENDQE